MGSPTWLLCALLAMCRGFTPSTPISRSKIISRFTSAPFSSPPLLAIPSTLSVSNLPSTSLYNKKQASQVLGGLKIGTRKLVVVTGASSGLGRETVRALSTTGKYFIVMAVRDVEKGKAVAKVSIESLPLSPFSPILTNFHIIFISSRHHNKNQNLQLI